MADEEKKNTTTASAPAVDDPTKVQAASETKKTVTPFMQRKASLGMLLVKIYTPFKVYYEGDARSVTAVNETGKFDVLPGHHNFITMLVPCDVIVVNPKEAQPKVIPIARGLMHIKDNKLIIFLDV